MATTTLNPAPPRPSWPPPTPRRHRRSVTAVDDLGVRTEADTPQLAGTGLDLIDVGEIVAQVSAVGVEFSLPDNGAAYFLDGQGAPVESIIAGEVDSSGGQVLVDLSEVAAVQIDADDDAAWTIEFLSEPTAAVLDGEIDGRSSQILRLGDGVVDVGVTGSGCGLGLEVSSWRGTELLDAVLLIDDDFPTEFTPPDLTEFLNVRGACDWSLQAR